jgi:ADP-ribose pyrophosphatase YjhB (NUDIX family)
MDQKWLEWAKRLQAAGQNGLAYNADPYNTERYTAILDIAAEITATHADLELATIHGLFSGQVGHATPKIDVRGVVVRDGAILLVRERAEQLWSLPGGWADVYDSPSQAVEREIWEESGYRARAVRLLALYDRARWPHPPHIWHSYKVFFHCEITGGDAAHSSETDGVSFFRRDTLPDLSVGRVTHSQIDRLLNLIDHPDRPAEFD